MNDFLNKLIVVK